jgi:hypothetical protein
MSRTPDFGGDQDDGATPSITPATPPTNPLIHSMDKAIADATGPVWATICHLEAAILGGPVCVPPRAGPGYCSEHID